MSRGARPDHLGSLTALIAMSTAAFAAAAPTAADLAHCAAITAPDARLACYDALMRGPADRGATVTSAPAAAATAPAPVTQAVAATGAASDASPAAPQPAPTPPPTYSSDPKNFGFSEAHVHAQTQAQAAPAAPVKIQAHVANLIESRTGQPLVVLDNGQAWLFVDPDDGAGPRAGDPVTIKQASLGSFLMLTPSKHSYHVRRTQ